MARKNYIIDSSDDEKYKQKKTKAIKKDPKISCKKEEKEEKV